MTDSMAQELISKIRGRKYAGSSLKNGKLYHDLPFPGFENFDSHRSKTKVRWNYIRKYVSVKEKSVLDIGCSVGSFSILSSLSGASKVLGVDYDRESIDLAKYVANKVGAKNVEFRCSNIDSKFAEELDYFDVVIWLSQWMWIVKQLGMDEAKKLLFLISKKSAIMIFESAADDGMAAITGMTQSDIEDIFRKNTCYSKVKNIGSTPGWKMRNILIGEI
jgi:SAM-dependent methyltransferase